MADANATTNGDAETALIIAVPDAEDSVRAFRDEYDPSAAAGVPAHVTLLYPFKPFAEIDGDVLDTLRQCFARFEPLVFSLKETRRFPGVLYLAPDPSDPFRQLTLAIWDLFPETPPYGGRHDDIVPHLCIAQVADEERLDRIAADYARASHGTLPIQTTATEVTLIDNRTGRWQTHTAFGLAGC